MMKQLGVWVVLMVMMVAQVEASLVYRRVNAKALKAASYYRSGDLAVLSFETSSLATNQASNSGYLQVEPTLVADMAVPFNPSEASSLLATTFGIKRINVYPNPMKSSETGHLYYELSKNGDVDISVFDMLGRTVTKQSFKMGVVGGLIGVNKVTLAQLGINPLTLPSGAYVIVVMSQGKVIAKGKMAVVAG
ncbi:T9SS C-terminal target domain-containing protein [bacterium]|nr:T9SS C-terminal target domain-containing protein [bacterium]